MGKLLISRDQRLSITYLIVDLPYDTGINAYTNSLSSSSSASRLGFIHLDSPQKLINDENRPLSLVSFDLITSQQPKASPAMFCYTSSAGFLGLKFHSVSLKDEQNIDIAEYKDSDDELTVSSFTNPVPSKVLPSLMVDKLNGGSEILRYTARKILEAKGIILNTFLELEQFAIESLSTGKKNPPVYTIGPVINLASENKESAEHEIMSFLDNQPRASVVFLCFGSQGWFPEDQVKEIAYALERSRCRFLWSLKRPLLVGSLDASNEYQNPEEVLPRGFLGRTSSVGKVIGKAPQVDILSHPAIGGFVSHCGWNSILESLWFGVPIAAWPSYAEQQFNAFEMVVELGVDIRMDYKIENCKKIVVGADEIESSIRRLMMMDSEEGMKVKELQCKN